MNPLLPWIDVLRNVSDRLGPGLSSAIRETPLPALHGVRQHFPRPLVEDVAEHVRAELARPEIRATIRPGARICVGVGSRGINQVHRIAAALVAELIALQARPFIIPTMGSHGGATPEGQRDVLAEYGVTEEAMGCPIVSSLEVRQVGTVLDGIPVFCSVDAMEADGIIVIGRVKPHTGFRGRVESGLMKMMVIGLGKQKGADNIHAQGSDLFPEMIPAAGQCILDTQPVLFGLAVVENGYDQPAVIEAVLPEGLLEREAELLTQARTLMPTIPFERVDLLIIQQIGKNISGSGMDPNVCGRFRKSNGPQYEDRPAVQYIVVLDLTPETHGNAAGIGQAEFMSLRVLQKIDLAYTYANCLTASSPAGAVLPVVLQNDRAALQTALKSAARVDLNNPRVVLIHNTLDLQEIWISPALLQEAQSQEHLDVEEKARPMEFDEDGNILWPVGCGDK